MKINQHEIDFRISRLKDAAALEAALDNMAASEKKDIFRKDRKLSEVIKASVEVFRTFFLDATGADILENCEDLDTAKKCYLQFLSEVQSQKAAVLEAFDPDGIR